MKHFLPIIALLLLQPLHSAVVKKVLNSQNDLQPVSLENIAWTAWEDGYVATDEGFVCDNGNASLEQCVRIRTGETGPEAIG